VPTLSTMSTTPDRFTEGDVRFLGAVAEWIGMIAHRGELVEQLATDAERRGRRRRDLERVVEKLEQDRTGR
jgi:GAF domain-containing protein